MNIHVFKSDTARQGYYVEDRYFKDKQAQAAARARLLTAQYGRQVDVALVLPVAVANNLKVTQ